MHRPKTYRRKSRKSRKSRKGGGRAPATGWVTIWDTISQSPGTL